MNNKYTLKEFFTNSNIEQVIIPEIQRDYVWKEENVERLLESICENAKKHKLGLDEMDMTEEDFNKLSPKARDVILREMEDTKIYCNVGFFYAYTDPEMAGRCILIDGQQRMTTLFLLLVYLSIKENKQDKFKNSYLKDGVLKFDYKVRESAHEFLLNFVTHLLSDKSIETATDQYWYFSEYEYDATIQSLLTNYEAIKTYLAGKELSLDYVGNFIEFWYFDTDKSSQGEELYIYMNSRGESVSSGENIKANLLKNLSDDERHTWGEKWESWQSFFWRKRNNNLNADKGIEEFLRWIKIIELVKSNVGKTVEKMTDDIKLIKEQDKVTSGKLKFALIETYFDGINRLIDTKNEINWHNEWFSERPDAIHYFKFFPLLMYVIKYPNYNPIDLQRFARFFFNLTRFDNLSRNPYSTLVNIIRLVEKYLDAGYTDVTDLLAFKENYKTILTVEEVVKLTIYKLYDNQNRNEIELAFWQAEDFKLCNGTIWFIWDCINYDRIAELFDNFKLEEFNNYFSNFNELFSEPDDLVRRSLLTKGDYKVWDGYSTSLDANRYSFFNEEWRWKNHFEEKSKNLTLVCKKLLIDYCQRQNKNTKLSKEEILNNIISDFLHNCTTKDWIYYFINKPDIFKYCKEKKVCFCSNDINEIVLLEATKAYSYKALEDFLD
jgi:uncharacterized protein with ParB-like and HNH nuclease domain